jgi:hypothetical protein
MENIEIKGFAIGVTGLCSVLLLFYRATKQNRFVGVYKEYLN